MRARNAFALNHFPIQCRPCFRPSTLLQQHSLSSKLRPRVLISGEWGVRHGNELGATRKFRSAWLGFVPRHISHHSLSSANVVTHTILSHLARGVITIIGGRISFYVFSINCSQLAFYCPKSSTHIKSEIFLESHILAKFWFILTLLHCELGTRGLPCDQMMQEVSCEMVTDTSTSHEAAAACTVECFTKKVLLWNSLLYRAVFADNSNWIAQV